MNLPDPLASTPSSPPHPRASHVTVTSRPEPIGTAVRIAGSHPGAVVLIATSARAELGAVESLRRVVAGQLAEVLAEDLRHGAASTGASWHPTRHEYRLANGARIRLDAIGRLEDAHRHAGAEYAAIALVGTEPMPAEVAEYLEHRLRVPRPSEGWLEVTVPAGWAP